MSSSPITTQLTQLLATTVDFYYTYKHFHWNITCEDFYQFHTMFDSHATTIYESQDTIAERIRQLDVEVSGDLIDFSNNSVITKSKPNSKNNIQEVLKFILDQHKSTIELLEATIKTSNEANDYSTADLLTAFLEEHQKMAWFVRSSVR
jgi:starvation-inducible DNA-binding protein